MKKYKHSVSGVRHHHGMASDCGDSIPNFESVCILEMTKLSDLIPARAVLKVFIFLRGQSSATWFQPGELVQAWSQVVAKLCDRAVGHGYGYGSGNLLVFLLMFTARWIYFRVSTWNMCAYAYVCMCAYMETYVCVCVCMCICIVESHSFLCVCPCVCAHTCTRAHIYVPNSLKWGKK
jgi:hypothetical protein